MEAGSGMIGPTPEDRARMTVRVLEQAIRESRNDASQRMSNGRQGMSLRQWQDVAEVEIANAIRDAEKEIQRKRKLGNRISMVVASCLVTIGFFGFAVSWGQVDRSIAAVATMTAGMALFFVAAEMPLRMSWSKRKARKRAERFENIRDLDKQIKRMEKFLEDRKKSLKDRMEDEVKAKK